MFGFKVRIASVAERIMFATKFHARYAQLLTLRKQEKTCKPEQNPI